MCRDIGYSLFCVWFWGDSEPSNFPIGLQSMPSIPNNLISLDTNMALLVLRLVAYHLPEEYLCSWATSPADLVSGFVRNLLGCSYHRFIHCQKIIRLKTFLKTLNIPVSLTGTSFQIDLIFKHILNLVFMGGVYPGPAGISQR